MCSSLIYFRLNINHSNLHHTTTTAGIAMMYVNNLLIRWISMKMIHIPNWYHSKTVNYFPMAIRKTQVIHFIVYSIAVELINCLDSKVAVKNQEIYWCLYWHNYIFHIITTDVEEKSMIISHCYYCFIS